MRLGTGRGRVRHSKDALSMGTWTGEVLFLQNIIRLQCHHSNVCFMSEKPKVQGDEAMCLAIMQSGLLLH